VVPVDVAVLNAGDVVPGDGRLSTAADLLVAEASLTGEGFPVETSVGVVPSDAPLGLRTNCLFLGTSVVSGAGRLLVAGSGSVRQTPQVPTRTRTSPESGAGSGHSAGSSGATPYRNGPTALNIIARIATPPQGGPRPGVAPARDAARGRLLFP
jgi:hypothetical protein